MISVLVPYRASAERERLREFTQERLESILHDFEPEFIYMDDRGSNSDLFNHGQAINRAASIATNDLFLIADADTTCGSAYELRAAIKASLLDKEWRLPQTYIQATPELTADLLSLLRYRDGASFRIDSKDAEWTGNSVSWSGLVVVPRAAFEAVRGYDERYLGWGSDDVAFGLVMTTIYAPVVRYGGEAVHLWHTRGDQENGWHRHSVVQRALTERYEAAVGNVPAMQALIEGKRI